MTSGGLPSDYLEKVYAGVLGKVIGVYLGRPFEGWTHERILDELGPIHHFVHKKLQLPLVVTDDDVSGTFVFIRALEEHGVSPELSAENIGKSWLNNTVEKKSVFAWAGRGILTEHTAYLNLKHGIKAPASGSIQVNGQTLAEQIGAQIFIDGWGLVAPGKPHLAARLAEAAGSVSHDGVSVHAAKLWAAMEAEAFVNNDVDHLLDVGLNQIPGNSLITRLISDVRAWATSDRDWKKTRQRIEERYGYHKFPGLCHVVPNHAIMISALIYGGHDFDEAMHIINTSGWDTDCNSGNVGCLVAIMHGLDAFKGGQDWRDELADRCLISSADGGYSVNNASRIAYDLARLGQKLAGEQVLSLPKDGAQYHFTLPGSVQGFRAYRDEDLIDHAGVRQSVDGDSRPGLVISLDTLSESASPLEVLTETFTPPDVVKMPFYELMATPLVSPGQTVKAVVRSDSSQVGTILVTLRVKHYNAADTLSTLDGVSVELSPGRTETLTWTIPDVLDSQPIQKIGLALSSSGRSTKGSIWLDSLSYCGTSCMTLQRPSTAQHHPFGPRLLGQPCTFWRRAWIHNLSTFSTVMPAMSFCMAQDEGEALCMTGTREWVDYKVSVPNFRIDLGGGGLIIRVQGLNRYYALVWKKDRRGVALVKARDQERTELASADLPWSLGQPQSAAVAVRGHRIKAFISGTKLLEVEDAEYTSGGFGVLICDGSVAVDRFDIGPV